MRMAQLAVSSLQAVQREFTSRQAAAAMAANGGRGDGRFMQGLQASAEEEGGGAVLRTKADVRQRLKVWVCCSFEPLRYALTLLAG